MSPLGKRAQTLELNDAGREGPGMPAAKITARELLHSWVVHRKKSEISSSDFFHLSYWSCTEPPQ